MFFCLYYNRILLITVPPQVKQESQRQARKSEAYKRGRINKNKRCDKFCFGGIKRPF